MRSVRKAAHAVILAATLSLTGGATAATYYVDFVAGLDTNAGTSAPAPFQHAPGDPQAADAAKAVRLAPGDTVILKGGVAYRGAIRIERSGEPGRPITLDGNSAGTFGQGRAIVDGSAALTAWRRCESAEEAKGNPRWKDIFIIDIPKPSNWRNLNLCDGEKPLPVAQDPNPADPFFQESVAGYRSVDVKIGNTFPGRIYFEKGSRGNRTTPLEGVIQGAPAVVEPITGGAFSIELDEPATVTAMGIKPQPRYAAVREVAFYADGKELRRAELERDPKSIQRFDLPRPVTARKFTFKLLAPYAGEKHNWTKVARVAAYTADGTNILAREILSVIKDKKGLTATDPHHYDGMWVGVHAGNNTVYYRQVRRFEPATHRLFIDSVSASLYKTTRYCLYNSVRLIDRPGEFSVEPTADGKLWRIYLLPDRLEQGQPLNIGCSQRSSGVTVSEASHVVVKGLLVRRQGQRRASGIGVRGGHNVTIADCEITLVNGGAALDAVGTDGVLVENCRIHHCPGHTKGIVLRNCRNVSTRHCRLVKNTSTAVDYYGCVGGDCRDNVVSGHHGHHANGLTFYLGCRDIVIERNEVFDSNVGLTIQQAENITIRNNILDAGGRTLCVGIWVATPFRKVRFHHNLLLRSRSDTDWQAAVFSNNRGPEGLVFRNNIIDGLSGNLPGTYEHNVYTRWGPNQADHKLGKGEIYEPDLAELFVDPANRDYRPRPGSPAIDAGADVGVNDDARGVRRPQGRGVDIGAYEYKPE